MHLKQIFAQHLLMRSNLKSVQYDLLNCVLQLQSLAKKHGDIVPIGTSAEVCFLPSYAYLKQTVS